jgi:hypothetical protein
MVQAAVSGALDFARADPQDSWWWSKLQWTIDELARQRQLTLSLAQQQHWLAYVGHTRLSESGAETVAEQTTEIIHELSRHLFPWSTPAAPQDASNGLRELWVSVYGDLQSPETQAMVRRGIEEMQQMQARKRARKAAQT